MAKKNEEDKLQQDRALRLKCHKLKMELKHYKQRCKELELVIKNLERDDMR